MANESIQGQGLELCPQATFQPDKWPKKKTIDIGNNGTTVSTDPYGGIYQISSKTQNTKYAMMIAAPWHQFDQNDRQKPEVVREYRKQMERRLRSRQPGLGLRLEIAKEHIVVKHVTDSLGSQARIEYLGPEGDLCVQTHLTVRDDGTIIQATQFTNTGVKARSIPVTLDLSFAISRASYGQLTDQGKVPMPDPSNVVHVWKDGTRGHKDSQDWSKIICFDNESLGGRLSARVSFLNVTSERYIRVEDSLLPWVGQDPQPPSRLLRYNSRSTRSQKLHVGPSETIQMTCAFLPENINFPDPGPCWGFEFEGQEFLSSCSFTSFQGFTRKAEQPELATKLKSGGMLTVETKLEVSSAENKILWANLNYIIGCCSVPVKTPEDGCWAVVPDHIALPLGWPRDNYWQLKLLSKVVTSLGFHDLFPDQPCKALEYFNKINLICKGHLEWLFHVATTQARIDDETRHFWRRSYLINGKPKDGTVYQLDTQLYPFLQLCEYYGDLEKLGMLDEAHIKFVRHIVQSTTFTTVLLDILRNQDPDLKLFKTDETPADDDTKDFPFHLSSNVLVWHTLMRLSELFEKATLSAPCGIDPAHLRSVAKDVQQGVLTHLICDCNDGSGDKIFAYALDPKRPRNHPSRHRRYHDGNDMPTVLAPEWGFLRLDTTDGGKQDDPALRATWEQTIEWALTPDPSWTANPSMRVRAPGHNSGYAGNGSEPFHGLGSDHSEGAWVLGFFQEWKYARLVGDAGREARAWSKIEGAMQWDGTFPEAVDVWSGECTSKTWFSWPGAMIAAELVETVVEQTRAVAKRR